MNSIIKFFYKKDLDFKMGYNVYVYFSSISIQITDITMLTYCQNEIK